MEVYVYVGRGGRQMFLPERDPKEEEEAVFSYKVAESDGALVVTPTEEEPSKDLPPERVFAYGTLTDPEMVVGVLNRLPTIIYPAVLEGYELALEDVGGRYNTIREREGSEVKGALLVGLSDEDIRAIDRYEGYPVLYERERVEVKTSLGSYEAYVYIARE
ncbi:gamma-glutamylcyclotransferase family protein [Methanopyrus kandleri]|uniref:Putative gamma-glutamylcyclotransferase n=1 Tax=Methanopyrus kandleri TaxID=2320 RepID=A0A832T153_9EURY|nr:gamma-glutamylcyclotransferase family protein [Methanopyrus kandleri]HII69600.1 gamma-glutamylcyclotransferase [Methanopyrus kandleri]